MDQFKITFKGNLKVDVGYKDFTIHTDQAKESGGDETAPEPFEIFLAGLGSCAGVYAKTFCDVRKISTQGMHLTLDIVKKKTQKRMEKVVITLYVNQQFPEKYIRAIIKSMEGCSVKNQLHPDIQVETTLAYLPE